MEAAMKKLNLDWTLVLLIHGGRRLVCIVTFEF